MCWGAGFGCAPPLLGEGLGCVSACVPVLRGLRHLLTWGAVRGAVVGPGLLPCPATLGLGVGACACLCVRPACTPLFLGVCGCCRWWGLPPPLPFGFFLGRGGALRCRLLVAPVLGLPVSVPLSLLFRAPLFVVCFFFPRGVCLRVLGVHSPGGPLFTAWCCWFWPGGPPAPLWGVPSSVPSGWGGWPPLVVLVGGVVAVGRSRAPPPLVFVLGRGSARSSLCLPWAGARTGRHSVWLSGLLLVVAFSQAVPRPHGSGGLSTRWARRPFLTG